ncbi:zinc finger SWIM domain-containing protein 3 [Eleutherodactylus coqui]|uniref:SWIM-type domain-containing protein n=1 Tax=Eleutherodactylus coqui TaxID=57060 RepID=A0A8J6JZY2_ELECQ|nr:hypothetical protein GDO78_004187 [Eleutherodactylus coqui]
MQRGTCFMNYEDFKECFNAYKKETKSSYSIQSSVSVRHHNSKFGTDIRPDIIFTEVKFCCSKLQVSNVKRKPQDAVCPAYFFIQYDTDLDRLVVKEECLTHIHSKEANPAQASFLHLTEMEEHSPDLEVPFKKICSKRLSLPILEEDDQEEILQDLPSPDEPQSNLPLEIDIGEGHSQFTTVQDSSPEGLSGEAFSRLDALFKDFQRVDHGSKLSLTFGAQNQLQHLCFQTSNMGSWFVKFPESLLLNRVFGKHGYILYAFLVETKERMAKIVHFAFVKEENSKNILKMLEMLKDFNPEWPKVKVIYTDISFEQKDILKKAFPSVRVLLSVYHTVRLIERKIKGPPDFIQWVHKWIGDAIYQTTPQKLSFLAEKLEHNLDQDLYAKLCQDWFSNELLWYMHVKKGMHSCNTYMDSIGLIDATISSCLAKQSSMENAIKEFLKSGNSFNNKGLDKGGYPGFSRNASKAQPKNSSKPQCKIASIAQPQNAKKLRPILPALLAPLSAPEASSKSTKTKAIRQYKKTVLSNGFILSPKLGTWRPIKLPNKMLLSLKEFCNDLGFQLCSKEWEVVQRSTHLIGEQSNFTTVQILEESHNVSLSGHSCTCHFYTDYKLPCRHILSMLYVNKRPVEENMVSLRWRKSYVKPISDSRVYGKVLHYTKSKAETMERIGMIKSLTKEFYNLLMQCEGPEMQVRISTLQMIVDMWHEDASGGTPCTTQETVIDPAEVDTTELPYRWVKKEPTEDENGLGFELCRLDPEPPLS